MKKKRKYPVNIWAKFKKNQYVTDGSSHVVHDEDLEMMFVSWADYRLNRKKRTRIGILEAVKPRVK